MGNYRYYCRLRPPMIGGLPFGRTIVDVETYEERRYEPEIDSMVWGWVEYAEPLTPQEIADYELRSAPREE